MSGPLSSTSIAFLFLVLLMAGLVARALARACPGGRARVLSIAVFVLAYLALPAGLAGSGALDRYDPPPPPALLLLLGLGVLTVCVAMSSVGERVVAALPLAVLVGFQAFRVPVEWVLHRWHAEGIVPVQMTWSGLNLDVASGATAALLGALLLRRPRLPRPLVFAWNLLGLGLLVNIVGVAVLSTPTALRAFPDGPPNLLPSTFPFVWLPCFLVQLALFGHVIVFRRLRADARAAAAASPARS